ncbi:MAG: DUF3850 domain-containing protein [Planctomycetes bacterium]|nr:DUF3850 domain-containing protein [Planctomycetota bacterium]
MISADTQNVMPPATPETEERGGCSVQRIVGPPPRKVHTLKIWPQYLDPIGRLEKTFEVRKSDRDFRVGDILHLREWFPDRDEWGARNITCFVTYIMHGPVFGIEDGYCVMGIAMPRNHRNHSWPNERRDHGER